jgi:energy-coupling factor transporter ATP-binding protein EcfA2
MSDQPPASPPSKIPALSSPSASSSTAQRLTKIEIENYRAYRGTFRLDLANGENLLVYGENGAGKSSLFHTLRTFLEAPDYWVKDEKTGKSRPVVVTDHRHCFSADVPEIKLKIGAQPFVWTETINDTVKSQVRLVNQGKGFLDYKALLDVHYVRHGGDDKINVFDLLIERLLPYYTYPNRGQNQTFQVGWKKLKEEASKRWYGATRAKEFKSDLATFNDALESEILTLGRVASNLLARFGDEFGMEFQFQKATFQTGPKHIEAPRILVRPAFRKKQFDDYHNFLNEARLSALAICLFFAALKGSPASGLRILALDDILIGLDMANRLTVLGLVEDMFREWQVIVLTYHKAWFEILKSRTQNGKWPHGWKYVTMRSRRALGVECPVVVTDSGTLLGQARAHWDSGDAKAAAVYARSAWEALLNWYCEEWHLPVTYVEARRELDTDAFLRSITRHLETIRDGKDREWALGILQEIRHARRFVLNPNAHYDPEIEDEVSAEIDNGIRAVEDFELLLRCLHKHDFGKPNEEQKSVSVGELICSALEHLGSERRTTALDGLNRAFEQHLDELFRSRKEVVPYGQKVSLEFLFTESGSRGLFRGTTWKQLKHADRYLLGRILPEHLDPSAYEKAARLLLRLRIFFLLSKRQ